MKYQTALLTVPKLVLFLLLLSFLQNTYAKRWDPLDMPLPELEVIPGATSQWVGKQMAHDGMPLSIRVFSYPGNIRDVEKFYTALFKSKGHGEVSVKNLAGNKVIGYELRGYIYSVQFHQEGSMVEGKLTVSPVPGRYRKSKKSSLPVAPGCKVLNKIESLDFGKRSETLTLTCQKSLDTLRHFYLNAMRYDKWSLVGSRQSNLGRLLDFQRESEIVQINIKQISQKNKRLVNILINWIRPQ